MVSWFQSASTGQPSQDRLPSHISSLTRKCKRAEPFGVTLPLNERRMEEGDGRYFVTFNGGVSIELKITD